MAKKKKKLNGFQKKQKKLQRFQGTPDIRFMNLIQDIKKKFNMNEPIDNIVFKGYQINAMKEGVMTKVPMNNQHCSLSIGLITQKSDPFPVIGIDPNEYELNGLKTCFIDLDMIYTSKNAPKNYGSKVLKYLQKLCGRYNFDICLISNDIQRNPEWGNEDFESTMEELYALIMPYLSKNEKNQMARFRMYDQELRDYASQEPKYTGKETRTHLWNFYKRHGFVPNVWYGTRHEPDFHVYHRKLVWFNPNSKNTDHENIMYPSVVGENKLFTYEQSIEFLSWVYDHDRVDLINKNDDRLKTTKMISDVYANELFKEQDTKRVFRYDELFRNVIETQDPILEKSQSISIDPQQRQVGYTTFLENEYLNSLLKNQRKNRDQQAVLI